MPPSSIDHGGQHDTKYVALEWLMRAAFVADEIWGFRPEAARIHFVFSAPCCFSMLMSNESLRFDFVFVEHRSRLDFFFTPYFCIYTEY